VRESKRHKERLQCDGEGGGGGGDGKRNAEGDGKEISRGTHGRSVSVAGGWRIGRVAMEKRAGGVYSLLVRRGPPRRETPIREIRGVATPKRTAVPEV